MLTLKWIKRLLIPKPTPIMVLGDRSKVACSHIVINQDGSTHEFLTGSVAYGKGCELVGGHKPITTIESK